MRVPVRKMVVGLGNPGPKYAATRHNVGFRIAERFAADARLPAFHRKGPALESEGTLYAEGGAAEGAAAAVRVLVMEPQTYVNLSGGPVARRLDDLGVAPADLLVCYDELALPLAQLRVRPGGSAAGHNGLQSIIDALGTQEFPRLRFGIRPERPIGDQARFVLTPFGRDELTVVEEALTVAARAVATVVLEGVTAAMNRFNRAGPAAAPPAA